MPKIDSEKFYLSSLKKYGNNAKGLNWVSRETQELRFDIIIDMLPNKLNSIVDAGCGLGDFYTYLQTKDVTFKKYIGIDSLHKMCTIAHKNTKQEIILADITKEKIPFAEYYVCSGAMNILNEFETYLFIQNCIQASQKAFIFNILHGDKESKVYNYFTSQKIEELANKFNVKNIRIEDSYLKNDITIGFYL
ncbi:class I SAM-dependent methyltransferase [Sulfurimonas sp.]|nr:class I SAM-dependent methyltransferase [Sulfurimonas sp.]